MHIRKLVKSGEASHTVSLPKGWIDENKLTRGDLIYIDETHDNELLVTAKAVDRKPAPKELTINIDGKHLNTVQREITSAYINNFNTINIIGKEITQKARDIRRILHDFVALEIGEQTGTKIVANDLLNVADISVEKTIRRMDMIVRSIIQDSISALDGEDLHESIIFRDYDVNRQYFLVYRILKGALDDKNIAKSFGINNSQALSMWYLSINLENLADHSKNISQILSKNKVKSMDELKELYAPMQQAYLDVMKAYFTKDVPLADSVNNFRVKFADSCDSYFEKNNKVQVAQIVTNLKDMSTMICNIARIVMDYN